MEEYQINYKVTVCAWCNKTMGKEQIEDANDIVSHGICKPCNKKFIQKNSFEQF